jgi:hypothetical protein
MEANASADDVDAARSELNALADWLKLPGVVIKQIALARD